MGYVKLSPDIPEENQQPFAAFTGDAQSVICKKPKKLERLLNAVVPGCNVHYLSDGYFSLHDVVISLVKMHAPVDIYFTTYALREVPVRQLVMCKVDGLINNIHVVLDYKAQVRSAEVNAFAEMNFTRLALKPIHAKVCVIQGAHVALTIIGSANWTTNPKTEAGVICESQDIAEFHKSWILKMINDEPIFK